MLVAVENRTGNDIDVFHVKSMTDVSRGSRTLIEVVHMDGEKDEYDLHREKITILPNAS